MCIGSLTTIVCFSLCVISSLIQKGEIPPFASYIFGSYFTLIMLLLFVLAIYSLIVPITNDSPARFVNNLLAKTVVLVEAELMYRKSENDPWMKLPEYDETKLNLDVYMSNTSDWQEILTNSSLVSENERIGTKHGFFFTAPRNNYYLYELYTAAHGKKGQYGMQILIHEGQSSVPTIKSRVDNHMKEAERHVRESTEKAHQIGNILKLDSQVDEEYRKIIRSIGNIIVFAIVMKIVVFYCMFYYFNRKLREFYVSKRIVK